MLQSLLVEVNPQSVTLGDIDGAVRIQNKSLLSDILDVIAFRGRDIARQDKAGKGSQSQIGCSTTPVSSIPPHHTGIDLSRQKYIATPAESTDPTGFEY
jgi:hypothetical protein